MKKGVVWAVVYVVFGAYFLNKGIIFYQLPELFSEVDRWVTLIGGLLILLGGINHFRATSHGKKSQ